MRLVWSGDRDLFSSGTEEDGITSRTRMNVKIILAAVVGCFLFAVIITLLVQSSATFSRVKKLSKEWKDFDALESKVERLRETVVNSSRRIESDLSQMRSVLGAVDSSVGYVKAKIGKLDKMDDELKAINGKLDYLLQCLPGPGLEWNDRVDCHPDPRNLSRESCVERGCCWDIVKGSSAPSCYFPQNSGRYSLENTTRNETTTEYLFKLSDTASVFADEIPLVLVTVSEEFDHTLEIKITDYTKKRFESPYPELNREQPNNKSDAENRLYEVALDPSGKMTVKRRGTSTIIFETKLSQMIFSDQFLQLTSRLPSKYVYGLAEREESLLLSTDWQTYTLHNKGNEPTRGESSYGSHPFYMVLEEDGNATGVALINSNSMDVILSPAPSVTFRPIGGIFHFLILPGVHKTQESRVITAPVDVVQRLSQWVGLPELPPYWALGFHLSKYGYDSANNTRAVYERNRKANIPYDVQWNDIDYMEEYKDFTYDHKQYKELPDFIKELHDNGMYYVPILEITLSNTEPKGTYEPYEDGVHRDIFVKTSKGDYLLGKVWNTNTSVYLDFFHPNTTEYWVNHLKEFHKDIPFDGIWLDMNEPYNFWQGSLQGCPKDSYNQPPYHPGGYDPMYNQTICMSARQYISRHYNVHNLYAISEAAVTNKALRELGKRPFIISRSSFLGQARYSGHWTGDIYSTWYSMKMTVPIMLSFSVVGMPMVGADICGFHYNTSEDLCARWHALGAFYPFSRNHNDINLIEQDPAAMGGKVLKIAKKALEMRYLILPYLYNLFVLAHTRGDPVARPLFFEFPDDEKTFDLDTQFLIGPAMMLIPVLEEGKMEVDGYFPAGRWYEFENMTITVDDNSPDRTRTLPTPYENINLFVRAGHVIPMQAPNVTTTGSRKNPFSLYVALDEQSQASGELHWDDGQTLGTYEDKEGNWSHVIFKATKGKMQVTTTTYNYKDPAVELLGVSLLDVDVKPTNVTVNKKDKDALYVKDSKTLHVPVSLPLFGDPITVEWWNE